VGSSNPRSVFLESLLVDWGPIEIELFENMFSGGDSLDCSQHLNSENDCLFACLPAQSRDPADRFDPRYLYI
jgi:hypothetical protein